MFLLSLTATCQVCTVSLKAGLYTYNGFAGGALDPPDGEAAQADPGVMGVAGQTAAATTAGLVVELKTQGEKKGKDAFDKCLAIAEQRKVGRLIVEIDGNLSV